MSDAAPKPPPFDHIFVPIGAKYVPLVRRGPYIRRRIWNEEDGYFVTVSANPRLVRFDGDRNTLYADLGTGLRRISLPEGVPSKE